MYSKEDVENGLCDGDDFYGQFISISAIYCVLETIGATRIQKARSDLADISPLVWDNAALRIREVYIRKSLADADACELDDFVGIAKASASLLKLMHVKA